MGQGGGSVIPGRVQFSSVCQSELVDERRRERGDVPFGRCGHSYLRGGPIERKGGGRMQGVFLNREIGPRGKGRFPQIEERLTIQLLHSGEERGAAEGKKDCVLPVSFQEGCNVRRFVRNVGKPEVQRWRGMGVRRGARSAIHSNTTVG